MSSALTTLENIRSEGMFYGTVPAVPTAGALPEASAITDVDPALWDNVFYAAAWPEIFEHALLSIGEASTEADLVRLPKFVQPVGSLPVFDPRLVTQAVLRVLQTLRQSAAEGNVSVYAYETTINIPSASGSLLTVLQSNAQQPGVILGQAWPHHDESSQRDGPGIRIAKCQDPRPRRFTAADVPNTAEVHSATIARVVACLNLLPDELPAPQLSPSPDGEIGLFWFCGGDRVDAYFDPEGHFTWVGKFNNQFYRGGDLEWQNRLPDDFLRMLNQLYS